MAFFDTWLKLNRKQIAEREREAPLRNDLFSRIWFFAIAVLAFQFVFLWRVGTSEWKHSVFPGALLLAAVLTRKRVPPFALVALFAGFVTTLILPIYPAGRGLFEYPQFSGALVLTILLAGLLMGKSYVLWWTVICAMTQFAAPASNWGAHALWDLVYAAAGWLVTMYSSHLQRLFEFSRVAEEQQRNAIVAERTRFARDIHDTLAQGFTGIMMQLNAAEQRLEGDSSDARAHIGKARQLAGESLEEARRSVSALRIDTLGGGSLLSAIEQIGRKVTSDSSVQLKTELEGQPYALPELCEANLLRIAQEALTNAVRHSGASRIGVRLTYESEVVLEIKDNGCGMGGKETQGFGLDGMRERACEIGAEIQIVTEPTRGTRIVVTVPNA